MRVRTKLFIAFSVLTALLWAVGFLSWNIYGNLNRQFSTVEEDIIPGTISMTEVDGLSNDIYRDVTDYFYHNIESAKNKALLKLERLREIRFEFIPATTMSETMEPGKDPVLADKIYDFYHSTVSIIELKERGFDYDTLLAYDRSMILPPLLAIHERANELNEANLVELSTVKASFNSAYNDGLKSIYTSAALMSILTIAAVIFVTRSIVRPLLALRKGTEMIARGNLEYKVGTKAKDEIGELSRDFDQMTTSLSTSMTSIDNLNQEIGERKRAEEALKESQEFASGLLENSPHAIVVINPDTSIKYVNPSWEELNGWTSSEIIGTKAPYPWWPDEHKESFIEAFKSAMEQGSGNAEIFAQKKNGEIYWIDMNWASVMHNGELQYLLINSIDVTERKQAEEALRETEEKFSKAFRASPDVMCITTLKDGTYVEVNESFTRVTGYTREEVIGRTTVDVNIWVNMEDRAEMLRKMKKHDRIYNQEFQFRVKSGEAHTMLFSAEKITIGGEPCALGVCIDITGRKKAEQLHKDENYVLTLLGQGAELSELLDAIVRLGESHDPDIKGSMLLFDPSKELLVQAAAPNLPESYLELMSQGVPIGPNMGSCGTAAYLKKRVIVPDIGDSPLFPDEGFAQQLISTGLCACWSQPIISSGGEVLGTIANYNNKRGEPSADNLSVLEWSARIAAIAIEHKRAEEALANEAIWRRILIDESLDGIVVLDENSKVYEANQRFAEMLGYSPEEVRELHTWDWDTQYTREELLEMGHNVDAEGLRLETYHQRKDGTFIDVDISVNGAMCAGKKLIFCVCRDVTARKQAEEALRESEGKFSAAFRSSPNSISISTLKEGVFLEVNDSFTRDNGYTREEVIDHSSKELKMWVKQAERNRILRILREKGQVVNEEYSSRTKSGEIRTMLFSAEPIDIAGKDCIVAVTTDITERKQMEEALRESEEKFSAAFRSSPDMMTIVNLRTERYTDVNDSFLQFTGYSRDELIGHTNQEFNMWVYPEEEEKMLRLMDEDGKIRHEEFHFRTKSGEIRTWLCSVDVINIGGDPCMLAAATDITARKKAQEALHESEERFSKVFHASPGSMSIIRVKDSIFLEVNESFLKDTGFTREEVIGHNSSELGIKDAEQREKILKMLQEEGKISNELTEFSTKTGEVRTGYFSAEFITLDNEPCLIVLTTDITQLKQAEEQLRLLSSVTQQVSDSTIVIGTDFKITYMNQAAQDLFGYTLEEARGNMLGLFDASPMTRKEREEIKRTITSGRVYSSISNKRRKDGSTIICDCRLTPLFDAKGEICSYIDVQRDITKQKDVEAKLQVHKQLIERILSTMPEGVIVIGSDDRILLANEAFRKIFHTGKKAISNRPLDETIPVKQLHDLYMAVKKGNEENDTLEFRYQVKGLEKRIACVITTMDGERTLLTFSDVSQEREEEEKLYLTDRLASIGEMAAGLAHELNNPLTGVLALSQLLMDSEIPGEYREDLECVYSEAKRAASIVKNVLLFARNNNYENGHASTNEVVKDVLRLRAYEEKVSNITAATKLEENLPDVPMDKFQLQQVFLNIILNAEAAIKESNKPGTLTVTTERSNNHVNIHFKDNGCGIDKHILPRIFDPFFTTKDIGKGTGLGLSICYGIVVKNGGKISVKSNVNKGTTFTVRMPVVPQTV